MQLTRKKAANFWAPRAIQMNGKPTRWPTRVLNRGEAVVAPRGRADDFAWPRPDISGSADMEALPDAVPPKGAAANSGTEDGKKKNTDKAATTKSSEATNRPTQSSPTPHVTTARRHRHVD
jgi:hypothetical protein